MTAPYSAAFHADKDDPIDGRPPAQIAYAALKVAGGIGYDQAPKRDQVADRRGSAQKDSDDPDLVGGPSAGFGR